MPDKTSLLNGQPSCRISEVARELGLNTDRILPHGHYIAKVPINELGSDDPDRRGRPTGFRIKVNELRIAAGAGFVVAICGNIVTMPGLPKVPAAAHIKMLPSGRAAGLT